MAVNDSVMGPAGASGPATYVEDVFTTYLNTGNGSTQTITNGIDLAGKGGLVWIKNRTAAFGNRIYSNGLTASGYRMYTNTTAAQGNSGNALTYASNGWSIVSANNDSNDTIYNYASWTFREQPKFFDIVTWTGNGANRTISHSLGSVPACIIVKRTDTTGDWQVYHRSLANTEYLVLNSTAAKATGATRWNSTTPTSSVFSVGTDATVNASGGTYVAYIYAHDAGGFGATGTDNVISCGSWVTDGTDKTIELGYEPQYILAKRTTATSNWFLLDVMRGFDLSSTDHPLYPNTSGAEDNSDEASPTATGFKITGNFAVNYAGTPQTWIYIAIRRGPMAVPTLGTSVFEPEIYTGNVSIATTVNPSIVFDLMIGKSRNTANGSKFIDRLRGLDCQVLDSAQTSAESPEPDQVTALGQTSITYGAGEAIFNQSSSVNYVNLFFKRAPGFFDVVCYTGTGTTPQNVYHNLGVVPELIFFKSRSTLGSWQVFSSMTSTGVDRSYLNLTNAVSSYLWTDGIGLSSQPTNAILAMDNSSANIHTSGTTYVAYLFATVAGVSKVGSYTGNGSSQTINCGFTTGARFFLVKATSTTGNWWVYDSSRGIISSNDPALALNSTAAEVTSADAVDADSSGIIVNQEATCSINASGVSYIFLAIA